MFSFFTELNRKRVPAQRLDFVHNTTCPIVHAADDRSVMETLEALPYQVTTARSFTGKTPYRIGPSGIGCRDNPHGATWTPNPDNVRVCLTKLEPRQRGLFGAAWTLGYIATFARTGIEAISMGAPTGPLGIIYRKADHKQPWYDQLSGPAVFPVYHVISGLTRGAGQKAGRSHLLRQPESGVPGLPRQGRHHALAGQPHRRRAAGTDRRRERRAVRRDTRRAKFRACHHRSAQFPEVVESR